MLYYKYLFLGCLYLYISCCQEQSGSYEQSYSAVLIVVILRLLKYSEIGATFGKEANYTIFIVEFVL